VKIFRTLSSIVSLLQSCKAEKHQKTPNKICFNFYLYCSEITIKDKVLKILTALLLTNVNLTRPQTTKYTLVSEIYLLDENYFLWGCSQQNFSGFKLLYHLGVISVNKFLKIKNRESLHADP